MRSLMMIKRNSTVLMALLAGLFLPATTQATAMPFDAMAFFNGRTEGKGEVKVIFSSAHDVHVHGVGRIAPDGALILDQTVEEQGKPTRQRQWRLKETAPGQYAGTLSDASSPVRIAANPNQLAISYTMKGGYSVSQALTGADGGRTLYNRMTIRKFGLTVATLNETIRKIS